MRRLRFLLLVPLLVGMSYFGGSKHSGGHTTSPPGVVVTTTTTTTSTTTTSTTTSTTTTTTSTTTTTTAAPSILALDSTANLVSSSAGTTLTISRTVAANSNRILLVGCGMEDTTEGDMTITGVSDNGTAMTQVVGQTVQTSGRSELWYVLAPSTGTANTVVTFTGTVDSRICGVISLYNARQQAPEASVTNQTVGISTITTDLTTRTSNAWLVDVLMSGAAESNFTATASQTELFDVAHSPAPGMALTMGYKLVPTVASTTMSWSNTDIARMAHIIADVADINGQPPPDNVPPTVTMTAPTNGSTVSGTGVAVSASASDDIGIAGVQFKLDGANLQTEDTSSPYTINWDTTSQDGAHTLTAVARDITGNTTTASTVSVTVDNTAGSGVGPERALWSGNGPPAASLTYWQSLLASNDAWWQSIVSHANTTTPTFNGDDACGQWPAIAYAVTGGATYLANAMAVQSSNFSFLPSSADNVRRTFPDVGWVYKYTNQGMTAAQKANYISTTNLYAASCINDGASYDSDQRTACYVGIYLACQAEGADNPSCTSGSNWLGASRLATDKGQIEGWLAANAAGGCWIESSEYNLETAQFLVMFAAQYPSVLSGLTTWIDKQADCMLHDVTYDNAYSVDWGDVQTTQALGLPVSLKRTVMLYMLTSMNNVWGQYMRQFAADLYGTSTVRTPRQFLLGRKDRTASSYAAFLTGEKFFAGQGLEIYRTSNLQFQSQHQGNNDIDHRVSTMGDWNLYRNGIFVMQNCAGYDTNCNEASSEMARGNVMLVDGQDSMRESRGVVYHNVGTKCTVTTSYNGGNRMYSGYSGPPPRWVHEFTDAEAICPAGASGIDLVVKYVRVYKDTAPYSQLPAQQQGFFNRQYGTGAVRQYLYFLHPSNAATISSTLATWTASGSQAMRAKFVLPSDTNLLNNGSTMNELVMYPTTPNALEKMLLVVSAGATPGITLSGDTLTITRSGETDVVCIIDQSAGVTIPASTVDGNNKLVLNSNLYQTYGRAGAMTCN